MRITKLILFIIFFNLVHLLFAENNMKMDSLIEIAQTANDTILVNTFLSIAEINKYSNKDTAIYYIGKAENEAKKINFDEGSSNALFMHGEIMYYINNYSDALDYFTKSLDLSVKMNNKLLKAKCLERLASLHLATGNPNLALKLYYESLVIFEELNNQKGIAKIYNILGIYKADTEEFGLAESYLNKSLEIHQQLNDKHNIIENKGNLGYLYEQTGNIEKAETIYRELIPEIKELDDMYALTVIYYNLASIYQNKGDIISAHDFLYKAIDISEQTNDTALLSLLYGNAGELLIVTNQLNPAIDFLNKSVLCSQSINDLKMEVQSLMLLVKIDSLTGDFTSALSKFKRIYSLKDKLHRQRIENSLKEAELTYENQKSQSKIELQDRIINTNNRNKWLFIILLIISSVALFLFARLIVLQKKSIAKNKKLHDQQIMLKQLEVELIKDEEKLRKLEKEKLEEELRLKERELVSSALLMDRSKAEFNYIKQKIKELSSQDTINVSELEELYKTIKLKLKDFDNWDLFYESFNQVHKDFFKELKANHPKLTKSELKHCAYIRIHLSTGQMASLLNVTIEAIRKTRYRVRKKLELDPNDSLENYLLRF